MILFLNVDLNNWSDHLHAKVHSPLLPHTFLTAPLKTEIWSKGSKNNLGAVLARHLGLKQSQREGESQEAFAADVTLLHVLSKEVWIIRVCSAAGRGGMSRLRPRVILSLLPELGFVQPSNQLVQETGVVPEQKVINIQLNQLPD